ncbi:MAG: DUF393 domain-containing protein [Gammaproteobacteria bacterium]|nr:DUF393 domain-containing protein [Gammaproteobacteria bacterium]MBL6818965.1 DUF393 domain-containing protein [Gammaproteobacteria bacterium]MBL6898948.1 DUF393 domain-containing protein [Gammaproteobacteria bacterium]
MKVLFNDSCSICSKEINHYKSIDNNIIWIDINNLKVSYKLTGKSHKELLRRLHVVKDGKVYSGVRAFAIMWLHIPKYKWLARLVSLPFIYHISILLYEIIAFFLYLKNKHQLNEKR